MRILTFLLGWLWRKPDGYWICGACSHVSKGSELLWNVWPVRQFVCPVSCCSHGVTRVTVTDWEAQEVRLQEEAAEQERQLVHEEWRQREEAAEQERQRLHEEEERQRATRREERLRKMWADFGDLLR